MGYNRENYRKIKREFEGKNLRAKEEAERRREYLHTVIPAVSDIDRELDSVGLKIFELSSKFRGKELICEIDKLKAEGDALLSKRASLLKANGFDADYSDVKYECSECSDTGFVDLRICRCMKKRLVLAGYESSGIGYLIETKTFDNFDPDIQGQGSDASKNNAHILAFCKRYAETFSQGSPNLLFIGGTGLGKTHISAAIAGKVIENGDDALCETAQNIFSDFEYERFNRPYGSSEGDGERRTDKYFECDLLIIDDLGTEMSNQFTISCLYNIVNTRINRGKATIINTNLTRDELKARYADRITSRLFGEFLPMIFLGRDVRQLKL